jgi:methionyl aminopeptidase
MITIKSKEEIKKLREGGRRLAGILAELSARVKPGMATSELDRIGRELAEKGGDRPAFLGYKPYGAKRPFPASVCISINDEIVHGIPSEEKILNNGDVVTLDMGLVHEGLITDHAVTVIVGKADPKDRELVDVTAKALRKGIEAIKPGGTVGDIGHAIEEYVKPYGFGHAEGLAGHGVGYKVHEDPYVPNTGKAGTGEKLVPGMVIAIEPMLTRGKGKVVFDKDGYTVRTKDKSRSAHVEHTVVVTERGYLVLTEK